jgi:hypothetical protein
MLVVVLLAEHSLEEEGNEEERRDCHSLRPTLGHCPVADAADYVVSTKLIVTLSKHEQKVYMLSVRALSPIGDVHLDC